MSYLKASDIARELSCSRSEAYEIMHEMPHLKHGRTVRVESAAFYLWRRNRKTSCKLIAAKRGELRERCERVQKLTAMTDAALRYLERGTLFLPELGFVYFAYSATRGLKVGFSIDPVSRLEVHFRGMNICPLLIVPGSFSLERFVHVTFASWLIPGEREWFAPESTLFAFVNWLAQEIHS